MFKVAGRGVIEGQEGERRRREGAIHSDLTPELNLLLANGFPSLSSALGRPCDRASSQPDLHASQGPIMSPHHGLGCQVLSSPEAISAPNMFGLNSKYPACDSS